MPKVEQYGGARVQTQVVSGPRPQGLPVGAFGADIGRGLIDLSRGLQQMQQKIDITAAEDAAVKFEREKNELFFNPDTGYFNTQGRSAYDSAKDADKALLNLRDKYAQTLESPEARRAFEQVAERHITAGQRDIMQHATKGLNAWEVATIEAQVENTIENASLYWNDPERLKVQNALGRQAVLDAAERQGITGDALNERLQTYESSFMSASITSALNSGSAPAEEMLDQYRNRLEGPDLIKLEKAIATKKKAEQTQFEANYAVNKAGQIVGQYDSRADIIDAVNQISNPDLRDKTMREAMYQFGLRKQAESEAQTQAFEDAESHLLDGGTAETFKMGNPEAWGRLSAKQQRKLEQGEPVVTDWTTYNDLMTMSDDQIKKTDLTKYFGDLAPTQRQAVISRKKAALGEKGSDKVESQVGRTRAAQTKSAIEQIFGKPSKQDIAKVNSFYEILDSEVRTRETQKGEQLTSQEYTDLLSGLTRQVTIQRSLQGIDWLAPDKDMTIDDLMDDTDPAELRQLREFLQSQNIPVTADNLINAYRQAKGQ